MLKVHRQLTSWWHVLWHAHISTSSGVHAITLPVCSCSAAVLVQVCHTAPLMPYASINAPYTSVSLSYTKVGISQLPILIYPSIAL